MTIWCIGMIVNVINTDCTERVANIKYSWHHANQYRTWFLYTSSSCHFFGKKRRNKKKGEKVMSKDMITEFPLWEPIPQERGVSKCDPDHDQGFVLITILVVLT